MSWKQEWAKCDHPKHKANNANGAKHDDEKGEQEGWTCQNCEYHKCKYCGDPKYGPCPMCGAA